MGGDDPRPGGDESGVPSPTGSGNTTQTRQKPPRGLPCDVQHAITSFIETIKQHNFSPMRLRRISAVVRAGLLPTRAPGRKPTRDAAYADYTTGMRGLKFFRRHIPKHRKLSR